MSMYRVIATSKVHGHFHVLETTIHSWKYPCTCDYYTFMENSEYVQEKVHENIHVPYDYIQRKAH